MVEAILSIVILVLSGLLIWRESQSQKERTRLINAVIAKTPQQFKDLETPSINTQEPILPPDLVPQEELSQEQWEKAVTNA